MHCVMGARGCRLLLATAAPCRIAYPMLWSLFMQEEAKRLPSAVFKCEVPSYAAN